MTAIWLATRDLRVHDNPALADAVAGAVSGAPSCVVPLFVVDPAIRKPPNRSAFLAAALGDLDRSLRERGAGLVVRHGDPAVEALRVAHETGARAICIASDVSATAQARLARLARACETQGVELRVSAGPTVVPPGALVPDGAPARTAYQVFTPYWRRWAAAGAAAPAGWRPLARTPTRLGLPAGITPGRLPSAADLAPGCSPSPRLPAGGEAAGSARVRAWLAGPVAAYDTTRDDLAADATSRLSPYLHLGCVSPLALATRLAARPEAEPFLRQLCWRDFYAQLLAARPDTAHADLRPRPAAWIDDAQGLAAWQEGMTGYPVVDAAMRQLLEEGFVHNRARMVVASFLTKHLGVHWREGARWFDEWLVDGDVASNVGNWQWVAGTGADTKPHRVFNPTLQGRRFDPSGAYVHRWVPELAGVPGRAAHEPWRLAFTERAALRYPLPIVDHADAVARYRAS